VTDSSWLVPALLAQGDGEQAARVTAVALCETFGLDVGTICFTQDEYSLNSVSGRARMADGTTYFFKFHHELGEQANVTEYYRAQVLSDAGLPVEVPVATSTRPGVQMVLYELRNEPRMADLCADLERAHGAGARFPSVLLAARRELDAQTGRVLLSTLRPPVASSSRAAVHQLFHHRLVGPDGRFPGGRYLDYYLGDAGYTALATKRWRVNGVEYRSSLAELAAQADKLLSPDVLAAQPVVVAHGDDHQGNVWALDDGRGGLSLRLFDPAFAGADLPALIAPVKAAFHNALAHPFWLYHPSEAAERYTVEVRTRDDLVEVTDDAEASVLRGEILDSAAELVWAPLLGELARRGALAASWRPTLRSALFCCPTLVTNLWATSRARSVRFLGLARAVTVGSEPVSGGDAVTAFLDRVTP
jgi:hypothetical protein